MRRIRMAVQYDGTRYAGWQRQENAISIQQLLEENLRKITGESVTIQGSGRTDSGVHAQAQIAHFDTGARMPADKFAYAFNTGLPSDIRVIWSEEAPPGFHARFSAKRKHYRYTINNAAHADALYGRYQLHVHAKLDVPAMAEAAAVLRGSHDFAAFKAVGTTVENTVRTLYDSRVTRTGDLILYDVVGSGFLYNMVRIIAGTLIEVGKGKIPAARMGEILNSLSRSEAGPTAPAQGLMLMEVHYQEREEGER